MDQWPLKFAKSFPRDWNWSMDGSSQYVTMGNEIVSKLIQKKAQLCNESAVKQRGREKKGPPDIIQKFRL